MILTTLVAAIGLGIAAQVIADRFQIPAILPLLVFGGLFGPAAIGLFDPNSLGDVMPDLVHLGVAIILFEGGLSLDPRRVLQVGGAVRNLLTIGVLVTAVGAAWLAYELVGMPASTAFLFGAVMTVTGPTVIVPLLRHMIAPSRVKTVLVSEGLMIDPIGAVLAYLVLQWIERQGIPWRELAGELVVLGASGAVLGFAAGALSNLVVRSRIVAGELRNLSILAILMVCYLAAESQAHQSGILAAVVMGFTMSASEVPDLVSLKAFKGQLTTLAISALFILLAGQLDVAAVVATGWAGVAVALGLIVLVRPVSVALSVWPSQLPWRDRLTLGLTAPRGIVAAAVVSLAARSLEDAGMPGGSQLEGLVYVSILVTGAVSTVVALVLPWVLGYANDPNRRRVVLIGANSLTQTIAERFRSIGRTTVIVDAVSWRLDRCRAKGCEVVCGDARDAGTYQEAGVERDSVVVAVTTNDELNLLVAELVHHEFGVEHPVVALQQPPDEMGRRSRAWVDLLGERGVDVPSWIRRVEDGAAHCIEIDPSDEGAMATLREVERESPDQVIRLLSGNGEQLMFGVGDETVASRQRLIVLVAAGRPAELLAPAARSSESTGPNSVRSTETVVV